MQVGLVSILPDSSIHVIYYSSNNEAKWQRRGEHDGGMPLMGEFQ
jgi:hypothetical protein